MSLSRAERDFLKWLFHYFLEHPQACYKAMSADEFDVAWQLKKKGYLVAAQDEGEVFPHFKLAPAGYLAVLFTPKER